ncbi:hypothetical protein OTU49_002806 [Cherax quadricarinatus]|uniref:RNA-binding region-containing protein 3 n=1 Tax=Cherax quadricarinatus TaxID=27406 RepID=A0AAW0XKQ3_CHEQU
MPHHLKVWSFDKSLTNADKEDLLKHFGAGNVTHISCRGQYTAVLASFRNDQDCKYALQKLHQLKVMGRRLMAVYKDSSLPPCSDQPHRSQEETKINIPSRQEKIKQKIREFESHLSALGPNIGFSHPIPPNLRYVYPPPSPSVIANIAQTLVVVPKFYTQVLHLMNKMNLPTPFESVTKITPLYAKVLNLMGYHINSKEEESALNGNEENIFNEGLNSNEGVHHEDKENYKSDEEDTSETESELESEGNDSMDKQQKTPLPIKRKLKPRNVINKKPKLSLLKQTCVSHPRNSESTSVKDVFEASESLGAKKLQMRLEGTVLPQAQLEERNCSQPGGFGKIESSTDSRVTADDMVEWKRASTKYITKEDLQANMVSKADWPLLTVFKNYQPGAPSTKLYIKNLAKTTSEENLKYIYGRYIFWQNDEESSLFSIRLMKEGRMKGQAFVTFPSIKQASEALEDTNGFILNDKPMVVVYGKVKKT